ncbi:unnamed protein product [Nippostrongylus brasiliensis]|uniref:TIL domain-containing protein n=1 Tax=Nippostrongylus brasiliensis TaxID=27835 RepID=A0A0N4YNK8_NIPBR|nr:unnamed protein product [Nippostrongylus brasiliensis]
MLLHLCAAAKDEISTLQFAKIRAGYDTFYAQCCPPNEQFLECGTACEPSCKNPNPTVCTLQCILNVCQCKQGFYRNSNNTCVDSCAKAQSCPANEEFKSCGTACEPSCDNPNPGMCKAQCIPNVCQCKEGFFRNSDNTCVASCPVGEKCGDTVCKPGTYCSTDIPVCRRPPCSLPPPRCVPDFINEVQLEPTCPANEVFKQCGTACEPSCENPNPMVCTKNCIVNVCQCKPGFFRNANGECVETCIDEKTCKDIVCKKGTVCKQNTIFCIRAPCPQPPPTCVPECNENEEYTECGTACEPTCNGPTDFACTDQCVKKCQCKSGFIRDVSGKCVAECPRGKTCKDMVCKPGTVCQQDRIECVRAPCPQPPPICVPATSCNTVKCPPGKKCIVMSPACTPEMCPPPVAQCV